MDYITGNGSGIHLVLSTGREYTFNCDDPVACITAFQAKTADDERQAMAVDEQTIVAQLETSIADEGLEKSIDDQLTVAEDSSLETESLLVVEQPESSKQ